MTTVADQPSRESRSPLVSVIMNCYNGETYLGEAIDSVLAQTYENWEIIFWDNQSTDRSRQIVEGYSDRRIAYFCAPTHTLLYEARNYALEKASGQFVAFLDTDDWWLPGKLEAQVPLFDDPEVGFACGPYWAERQSDGTRRLLPKETIPTGWVLDQILRFHFIGLVTLFVRRSAFDSLDYPFDPRYHIIGDFDLVVRLGARWKLGCVAEPVATYRLHDSNETKKHPARHIRELEQWVEEMVHVEPFGNSPNFPLAVSHLEYLKAVALVIEGDRRGALALSHRLPWGKLKVRILLSLAMPGFLARRLARYD